jgi:tetratricopeptide (TPR) repeat protein
LHKAIGKHEEAAADYSALLKANNSNEDERVVVLVNRAFCYGKLSKFQLAIEDYTEALSRFPHDVHCLFNRGICFMKRGGFQQVWWRCVSWNRRLRIFRRR